jgi:hypothetical protein
MGGFLAVVGVFVFVLGLLVALLSLPGAVLTVGVVVAVVAVFVVGLLLSQRAFVVRLDETGYQVRFIRGAGVKQGRWKDVEDVVATTVGKERCVVLRLRDGRTTTVPVRLLGAKPDDFVKDLREHLNRGHGYRPLR